MHSLFEISDMFAYLAFHAWAFPVYSGSAMEIILIIYSILEISRKFNVHGSLRFTPTLYLYL